MSAELGGFGAPKRDEAGGLLASAPDCGGGGKAARGLALGSGLDAPNSPAIGPDVAGAEPAGAPAEVAGGGPKLNVGLGAGSALPPAAPPKKDGLPKEEG